MNKGKTHYVFSQTEQVKVVLFHKHYESPKKCSSEVLSCPAPIEVRELTEGKELDLRRKRQESTPLPGRLCSGEVREPRHTVHPPGTHTVPTLLPVVTLAALRAPQQHQHLLKFCTETLSAFTCTPFTAGGELCV